MVFDEWYFFCVDEKHYLLRLAVSLSEQQFDYIFILHNAHLDVYKNNDQVQQF